MSYELLIQVTACASLSSLVLTVMAYCVLAVEDHSCKSVAKVEMDWSTVKIAALSFVVVANFVGLWHCNWWQI